jgi:hypothetical protein
MSSSARYIASLLAVAAVISFAPALGAQPRVRLGLGAGVTMPVGDIAKTSSAGINLGAALNYDPPKLPVGFEIDATYHNFAAKARGGDNSFIMSVMGGVTIPIAGTLGKPYLMAGVGYYNTQGPTTGATDAERDLGGYGGIGIRFRSEKAEYHAKAVFHEIFAEKNAAGVTRSRELIPISFTIVL